MNMNLNNRLVLVTGGAHGIGQAIARSFLDEGCRVVIWDRASAVPEVVAALSQDRADRISGQLVDVTDYEGLKNHLLSLVQRSGPVDHLVHAAAIGSGKFGFPFTNLQPDDWQRVLQVNIMGMTNIAHALTPGMIERRFGTMVFIASVAGQIGSPTDPPYSASKAANINFAQCMARDLAPHNIRVNTVCPGMVQTALNQSVWQAWYDQQPIELRKSYVDWAGEKIKNVVPLGRWQEPQDIADMVVFLSSDRARQITGQTINVDGGFVMHW